MADLSDKNAALTVKITGSDSSGTETNFIDATVNGVKVDGSAVTQPVSIASFPLPTVRQTYGATQKSLVPVASATDVFTITGSASKTIYVHKIIVTGNRTAHAQDLVVLIKRSTANSGGTSSTLTLVPYDSTNAAATAVVRSYTANPTLGTAVGEIYAKRVSFPVQTPSNAQGNGGSVNPWQWIYSDIGQPVVLRGTSEVLAINLNAVTIAGGNLQCSIEWSEE